MKYWITVATQEHVSRGQAGKYLQIGHGKRAPLARLKAEDWVVFYSPKMSLGDKTPVQAFTAIGQVTDDTITKTKVTPEFEPYRRAFTYTEVTPAEIEPLLKNFRFIPDKKNWQYTLRHGLIGIGKDDFALIRDALIKTTE